MVCAQLSWTLFAGCGGGARSLCLMTQASGAHDRNYITGDVARNLPARQQYRARYRLSTKATCQAMPSPQCPTRPPSIDRCAGSLALHSVPRDLLHRPPDAR